MYSILIIDVSGSTDSRFTQKISEVLLNYNLILKDVLKDNNNNDTQHYIDFRMGDELFFIGKQTDAIIIQYMLQLLWPFEDAQIKAAMFTQLKSFPSGNIEQWNSKDAKIVRNTLDHIKSSEHIHFVHAKHEQNDEIFTALSMYQTSILNRLSIIQKFLFFNSYQFDTQTALSEYAKKSNSTISAHLSKGEKMQLDYILTTMINYVNIKDQYDDVKDISLIKNISSHPIAKEALFWG
ncbi:hypothetical protein [Abyssicoccus albus]|uniref:SatD family protein n=1 Tax=Abyssicoccus albus TaxID=1817405 RepID=A0A3N5BSB6_9BACL|nr:hypothetical protein [Abyssicoccus albus]RPF57960.1 hypothetical protein EDD62_0597 [Abyssicoccus albus]